MLHVNLQGLFNVVIKANKLIQSLLGALNLWPFVTSMLRSVYRYMQLTRTIIYQASLAISVTIKYRIRSSLGALKMRPCTTSKLCLLWSFHCGVTDSKLVSLAQLQLNNEYGAPYIRPCAILELRLVNLHMPLITLS